MIKTDWIIKFFLFATPVCYLTNMPLIKFDIIFFQIATVSLFIVYLLNKPIRESKLNYLIPAFLALGIFNVLMHRFDVIAVNKLLNATMFIFVVYIIGTSCQKPESCYKYMKYALLVNLAVLFVQRIGYLPFGSVDTIESGGLMGNFPRLAIYSAVILTSLPIWLALITTFIIVLGKETCILIPLAVLMLSRINLKLKVLVGIVSLLLVAIFYKYFKQSISLRLHTWKEAISRLMSQPLIGAGWGVYAQERSGESIFHDTVTLSSFIDYVVGVGILSVAWLYFAVKKMFSSFTANKESFSMIVIVLLVVIEYPLEIPRIWFTLATLISFYLIKQKGIFNAIQESSAA